MKLNKLVYKNIRNYFQYDPGNFTEKQTNNRRTSISLSIDVKVIDF